jgi:hypothetical protein
LQGHFTIEAAQQALQELHGSKFKIINKRLTEKKAPRWLCKQKQGRFIALTWIKGRGYHWVAVLTEKRLIIDGALKRPCKIEWLKSNRHITRVYQITDQSILQFL